MRATVIEYTNKYRMIVQYIIIILFFIPWLVFSIIDKAYGVTVILALCIILTLFAIAWTLKFKIIFNYRKQIIVALEPGRFQRIKVCMNEIKRIQFLRVETERRKERIWDFFPTRRNIFRQPSESYVYNCGQQYIFKITKTNGKTVIISYNSLYRCKYAEKIEEFENKVNEILREFDEFIYPSKKRKHEKNETTK